MHKGATLKIASWNVNSIRVRLNQVIEWLEEHDPDVLCLQETKVVDELFPKEEFIKKGYSISFHGQKSYNGVAIISKSPLFEVKKGMVTDLDKGEIENNFDDQKRIISTTVKGIRIVNVYVPNGSDLVSEKYKYKINWLNYLKEYLTTQSENNEPICLLGDFNIALESRDIHDPEKLTGGIMASEKERDALKNALGDRLKDAFRLFETGSNHWSWWNYRNASWERDKGWRIDHIYLSNELIDQAISCMIFKKTRGHSQPSDHAPVMVDIQWPPEEEEIESEFSLF